MGKYNGAVVTTAGQNLIAEAISGGSTVVWTTAEISSYSYPTTTDFQSLTSLQDVEQTVDISAVNVFAGNILQVTSRFDNAGVTDAYLINTIGIYAKIGTAAPVLVAVVTAVTPDQMPVEDPNSPSAFIYNIQMLIQNVESVNVTVNPAGTATAIDLLELRESLGNFAFLNYAITAEGSYILAENKMLSASGVQNENKGISQQEYDNLLDTVIGNPNVLDNGEFTYPINQRGVTASSWTAMTSGQGNSAQYGIDRWISIRTVFTDVGTGVGVTFAWDGVTSGLPYIGQHIEKQRILNGGTMTLSAIMTNGDDVDGRYSFTFACPALYEDFQQDYNITQDVGFRVTYNPSAEKWTVMIFNRSTTPLTVRRVKLEQGATFTKFEQPNPALELLKCQYYYQRLNGRTIKAYAVSPSSIDVSFETIGAMRIRPSVVVGDGNTSLQVGSLSTTGGARTVTGFTINNNGYYRNTVQLSYTKANHGITLAEVGSISQHNQYFLSADL